jgi:LacI family transcriptional regulator
MELHLSDDTELPLYRRIADAISKAVQSGTVLPGQKLPPHVDLARSLGVNSLTVSRGYEYLENQGIIRQRRGTGTYVLPDAVEKVQRAGQSFIQTVWVIIGGPSLSQCRRETVFICMNIIDGLRDTISNQQTRWEFVESFNAKCLHAVKDGDAIAFIHSKEFDPLLLHQLSHRAIPIVGINLMEHLPSVPRVMYDRIQATSLAVNHLVQCGHKRIGYIGIKSLTFRPTSHKYFAFNSLLHESGLNVEGKFVRHVVVDPGRAYAATRDILECGDLPDAFFVDTDGKAMEVICALHDAGLKVPDDIAVAAYDNIPESATFHPPLTTVSIPRRQMGAIAGEILSRWRTDGPTPKDVILQAELVIRQSTVNTLAPAIDDVLQSTLSDQSILSQTVA